MKFRSFFFTITILFSAIIHAQITGKITYDDRVPPAGKGPFRVIDMSSDPGCKQNASNPAVVGGLKLGPDGRSLGDVIVHLMLVDPKNYQPPSTPVEIDQNGCVYEPRVSVVMKQQPVQFKNSDGILHNVHGLPKQNREFNIGMPPSLKEASWTPKLTDAPFKIRDDIHPWKIAYLMVIEHPFYDVTGSNGRYSINARDLEDGLYIVNAWHEKLGSQVMQVAVVNGKGNMDFSFKIPKRK